MEADEQEQIVLGQDAYLGYGLERDVSAVDGLEGVDDVGVAACNGAHLLRIGAGEDSGRHGWIGEAQGAGGEEGAAGCGADEELQGASGERVFFAGDLLRVGELARGGDEGGGLQDLCPPVVRECCRSFHLLMPG